MAGLYLPLKGVSDPSEGFYTSGAAKKRLVLVSLI